MLYVDGHGRVFARGPYDKGNLRELAVAWDNEGYANVAVIFATNFIPLPYQSKIKLATLQWAGVFGDRFILHETVDHLEEFKNGIADTQPASKAENMARQKANERDLPEDEKEKRKLEQEEWMKTIETGKKEKKDEKEKRKKEKKEKKEKRKKEKKEKKEKRKREEAEGKAFLFFCQEMKKKEKKEKRKKEKRKREEAEGKMRVR
ncbi:hypothetical protein TrRE_jg12071 [Triparma retinervis]|uniref:Uncharacterized protein n=1 Tax=Triparma retinervis TaxID=2557542 RepID=A0A9W7A1U1_9STRA|nr:hypothetical protein TrRE_jg12071 [Triparma retinervis]